MKFNKTKYTQKGSAYLAVLIVVMILSILGLSLFSIVTANFRLNKLFLNMNQTYYDANSVLSKAQVVLEKIARQAQEYAAKYVNDNKAEITSLCYEYNVDTGLYVYNEARYLQQVRLYYNRAFNRYILNTESDGYKDIQKYFVSSENKLEGITGLVMPSYDDFASDLTAANDVVLSVSSQKKGEVATKTVLAKYTMLKQAENLSVKKIVSRCINPIWERAVTSEKNIIATGGTVEIYCTDRINVHTDNQYNNYNKTSVLTNPAIYAWGKNATQTSREQGSNLFGDVYGGIIAGVDDKVIANFSLNDFNIYAPASGRLDIYGTTVTDSYIHTFYNNSAINISVRPNILGVTNMANTPITDMVYAESIQTERGSNNNQIKINGDALVMDDVEINGTLATVDITGSMLGLNSGSTQDQSYANKSSSLIYNDYNLQSLLRIGKYIFVGGVAYNDLVYHTSDFAPYKTGESIAIGSNNRMYEFPLAYPSVAPGVTPFDNGYRLNLSGNKDINSDPEYQLYSGSATDANGQSLGHNSGVDKRRDRVKDYYINYYKWKQTNPGEDDMNNYIEPNLGIVNGTKIVEVGYNNSGLIQGYSLGALPVNGKLYMPSFRDGELSMISTIAGLSNILKPFDTKIDAGAFPTIQNALISKYYLSTALQGGSARKTQTEYSDLVDNNVTVNCIDAPLTNGNTVLGARLINNINTPAVVDLSSAAYKNKEGLIIVNGDLLIKGDVDSEFTGAIVASGSIVFSGLGKKSIIYNQLKVLNAISLDNNVKLALSKGATDMVDPTSIEVVLNAQKNIKVVDYREITN